MVGVNNWRRIVGFFLDLAIVDFIITKPLAKLVEDVVPKNLESIGEIFSVFTLNNLFLISLLMGLLGVMYWSILEYKIGQTMGGLVFGLRMKTLDNKKAKFSQVFLRNVTKLNLLFLLMDSVHVLFSPSKQRFFEKISKTVTVEEK